MEILKNKFKEFFSLDYRSLAFMRMGMGLTIMLDLIERSHSLVAHYTDIGTLSRADLLNLFGGQWFVSIYMASGLSWVIAALFIIAGIFALMMLVGYRTRLATIVSFFFLISLHARNPLVLQGGDVIFRIILLWMIFLPTGICWSVDRLLNRIAPAKNKMTISPATVAYIIQVILIYVMAGTFKTGIAWHDGTAVYYALSIDQLIRPAGAYLRSFTGICHFLTYYTVVLETYGSVLYFSPFYTGMFRTIGICLYALLQVGFNLSMHLGYFGMIAIVATLGLLPPYFWDNWMHSLHEFLKRRAKKGLSIYYDTNCGFCYKMVFALKDFLALSESTVIGPAQDNTEIAALMYEKNSWVVIGGKGNKTFGFRGLATVVGYSPIFAWFRYPMRLPIIRNIGEYYYREIADNRLLVCLPEKEEIIVEHGWRKVWITLRNIIVIFLTIYVILWNIDTLGSKHLIPQNMEWIAWTTRLDQSFNMFAPTPLVGDGWYVYPGMLRNGNEVDVYRNGIPVSYAKPPLATLGYSDQRWQKYLMNLQESDYSKYRPMYARYVCSTWNAKHTGGQTLLSFKMIFMSEPTPPEGQPLPQGVPTTIWTQQCL